MTLAKRALACLAWLLMTAVLASCGPSNTDGPPTTTSEPTSELESTSPPTDTPGPTTALSECQGRIAFVGRSNGERGISVIYADGTGLARLTNGDGPEHSPSWSPDGTHILFTRHAVPVMMEQGSGTILMISSMAGIYGFAGEAVYCATKFAQVGFAQGLDKELRPHGIKVGVICPGGVKTEFALGKGRTEQSVAESGMLEPEDVAGAVLLACTQSPGSRIIEIQMRTMDEVLA